MPFNDDQKAAFLKYCDLVEEINDLYEKFRPALVIEYPKTCEVRDMDNAMAELYDNRMYLHMALIGTDE